MREKQINNRKKKIKLSIIWHQLHGILIKQIKENYSKPENLIFTVS